MSLMNEHIIVRRIDGDDKRMKGTLEIPDSGCPEIFTVERPWKDNTKRISCIPPGNYRYEKIAETASGKYKDTGALWLHDVPDRSEILVHPANRAGELLGCLAPGLIDYPDGVGNSKGAMKEIMRNIPHEGIIAIVDET